MKFGQIYQNTTDNCKLLEFKFTHANRDSSDLLWPSLKQTVLPLPTMLTYLVSSSLCVLLQLLDVSWRHNLTHPMSLQIMVVLVAVMKS